MKRIVILICVVIAGFTCVMPATAGLITDGNFDSESWFGKNNGRVGFEALSGNGNTVGWLKVTFPVTTNSEPSRAEWFSNLQTPATNLFTGTWSSGQLIERDSLADLQAIDWIGSYKGGSSGDEQMQGINSYALMVPEPGEIIMLLTVLGVAGWFVFSRRRRADAGI